MINVIGNYIGRKKNLSVSNNVVLSDDLTAKFDFIWSSGQFSGDNLKSSLDSDIITVTGKDFTTNNIPAISTATFAVPNSAKYLLDDGLDDLWFDSGDVLQQVTANQLITINNGRTIVRYSDSSPHEISWFGILKALAVLTDDDKNELTTALRLWYMYFDEWNDLGYGKQNRV